MSKLRFQRQSCGQVAGEAHGIALNGVPLRVAGIEGSGPWKMPAIEGERRQPGALLVAPQSYLFLEFPKAQVAACKHDDTARRKKKPHDDAQARQ